MPFQQLLDQPKVFDSVLISSWPYKYIFIGNIQVSNTSNYTCIPNIKNKSFATEQR